MIDDADRLFERLLVLRCQAGDEAAFAALMDRYQPRLRYYVSKMLFGLREPDDVLQEIWIDVFRAISRLIDADAFRAWLYQVARARMVKQFRKRRLNFQTALRLRHGQQKTRLPRIKRRVIELIDAAGEVDHSTSLDGHSK
jgi:RNA polymerase sigma factor (sigma-70 family)